MPYKRKEDKAAQMRRWRKRQKEALERLRIQFPDVYAVVFSLDQKQKKKPKKEKKRKRRS